MPSQFCHICCCQTRIWQTSEQWTESQQNTVPDLMNNPVKYAVAFTVLALSSWVAPTLYIPTRNISARNWKLRIYAMNLECGKLVSGVSNVSLSERHAIWMFHAPLWLTKKFVIHSGRLIIHSESGVLLGPAESGYSPDNTEKVHFGRSLRDLQ